MKDKAILYVGGGAMAGVFGAGIVTKLQEENVYEKLSHVYGASAGAFDIACFLSKQTEKCSTIYWEDLIEGFIDVAKLPKAAINISLGRKKFPNIVNIDHLIRVIQTTKKLDLEEIRNSPIEARIKVYNLESKKVEYLDLKEDTFQRLRESSSVVPYFYINGQQNIDGDVLYPIGYDFLRKTHPNQKIVFVLNHPIKIDRLDKLRYSLEGKLVSRMFGDSSLEEMFRRKVDVIKLEIEKIKSDKNSLLVIPPDSSPTSNLTTNPEKLKSTWKMGYDASKNIIKFLS